jgi:hypothetical protein
MRYRNLTKAALAQSRPAPALNPDGTWPNWPPAASDQPKGGKKKGKRSGGKARSAGWVVARAFKAGGGRYS